MTNPLYTATSIPANNAFGSSKTMRDEFNLIQAAFDYFPNINAPITPTNVEIGFISGVTSPVQTQLNVLSAGINAAGSVPLWASGTTYTIGNIRLDPDNLLAYTRLTDGGGTTKPSLDTTNWRIESYGGNNVVTVHTGNGRGSVNTAIHRFTTLAENTGSAITYADSATLGATFTINEPGIYDVFRQAKPGINEVIGVSLNSGQLTTSIDAITFSNRIIAVNESSFGYGGVFSRVIRCVAGDVIRSHGAPANDPHASDATVFSIRKIGS